MSDSTPYQVPREPGRWRAIGLAAVVHAALFAFLYVGIRWQNETPVAVEAEVWSPQTREAAPRAVAPPPVPEPEPEPVRVPAPRPQPVRPQPAPPRAETPPEKTPDIVLERERKRLQQQKAKEQELAERKDAERARAAEDARRQKAQLAAEQQTAQKRLAQQEAADQKRRAEADKSKQAEEQKKLAAARQKEAAQQEKQAQAKADAQHAATVRQLTEAAGAPATSAAAAGSGGNGDAARSQGSRADASYTQKVGAKIKSNTIFNGAEELTTNPSVEFAVELLPDGSIRRLRKTRPSGVPGFDEAVSRAIEKSQPFPPDKSGMAPSGFTVSHRPKDQ